MTANIKSWAEMYEKNHESQGKVKMTKQHWLLLTFHDFPVYNVSETWLIIIQTSKYKKTLVISKFAWIVVPVWESSDLAQQRSACFCASQNLLCVCYSFFMTSPMTGYIAPMTQLLCSMVNLWFIFAVIGVSMVMSSLPLFLCLLFLVWLVYF